MSEQNLDQNDSADQKQEPFILGGASENPFLKEEPQAQEEQAPEEQPSSDEDVSQEPAKETKDEKSSNEIQFDLLGEVNKSLGSEYGTIDELRSAIAAKDSLEELSSLKSSKEDFEKKFNLLADQYKKLSDPSSFFANDIEVKKNLLLKEKPSLNGDVAGKVFTADLEKMNPLDIIALDTMLKHSKVEGGEAGAKEWFLSRNEIDQDFSWDELTLAQKNAINLAAEDASNNIKELRDSVTMPEAPKEVNDLIAQWEDANREPEFDMSQWDGKIDPIIDSIKDFEIKDGDDIFYSEAIDEHFKEGLSDVIKEVVEKNKIEPTEENIKVIRDEILQDYAVSNMSNIMKRYKSSLELKQQEEQHKELHNDSDPDKKNTDTPSEGKTTDMKSFFGV